MATVLLAIFVNKTAVTLSHEQNSCHAPKLVIFKILSKVVCASECDVVLGRYRTSKAHIGYNFAKIKCPLSGNLNITALN